MFGREPKLCLVEYSDSDWAGGASGFVFALNGGLISYVLEKQAVIGVVFNQSRVRRQHKRLSTSLDRIGIITGRSTICGNPSPQVKQMRRCNITTG